MTLPLMHISYNFFKNHKLSFCGFFPLPFSFPFISFFPFSTLYLFTFCSLSFSVYIYCNMIFVYKQNQLLKRK